MPITDPFITWDYRTITVSVRLGVITDFHKFSNWIPRSELRAPSHRSLPTEHGAKVTPLGRAHTHTRIDNMSVDADAHTHIHTHTHKHPRVARDSSVVSAAHLPATLKWVKTISSLSEQLASLAGES